MTIATDARRVVRALPTPRVPGADASRRVSPTANASAVRIRRRRAARTPASPCRSAPRPQNRPQGGALCFRESIFEFTAHRLTRLSPVAPQKRDAMNEPVPSVPRKARTGTALDGIERGTQTSALPAHGFPSLARFPAKRRSAAFSPSRIAPHPDFPPEPGRAEGRSEGRVIRGRFPSDMSDGFFLSSPSLKRVPFSQNAIDSFVIAPRGL